MFPVSWFPPNYFPPNYWPKTGHARHGAGGVVGKRQVGRRAMWQTMEHQAKIDHARQRYRGQLRNATPIEHGSMEKDRERMIRAAATYTVLLSEI